MPTAIKLACFLALVAAFAAADRTFDEHTGRDVRNYPPDPQVDYQHLKLVIDMSEPQTKSFSAVETVTFKTLGLPISQLDLDAVDLRIVSVTDLAGDAVQFWTDDAHLHCGFPTALPPNTDGGLVITYSCVDPKDGMIFALPDSGYPDRPLQIHTQGESERNRFWFVSHDYPNEKMTSEIQITIPAKYKALANGGLVEKKDVGGGKTMWHYALSHPHVSYLVALVVGDFEVYTDTWRGKPVEYWVPPGTTDVQVRRTFGKTPAMLEKFSELLGVEYPYEKYAQSVVHLFAAGGMENTSMTTLTEDMLLDDRAALDQDREGLIAHELGHQWFGDMLTCKSWAHTWLNEGFASYMDAAWDEYGFSRDHYDYNMWQSMRDLAAGEDVTAHGGLVWAYYQDADEPFRRGVSNPYSKGKAVLHMLRQGVGEELFWKIMGEYVRRNAWKSVESDDLRKVLEEMTGRSYERFFQQWVIRPGAPCITASYSWDPTHKQATITLKQTQPITADAPAFAADVPVWVVSAGSVGQHLISINSRVSTLTIQSTSEPSQVCIDPTLTLLAKWDLDLPSRMLSETAKAGPTVIARLQAIQSLGEKDQPGVCEGLAEIMNDETAFFGLRGAAAASLARLHTPAARQVLLEALAAGRATQDHKARRLFVRAIGDYRNDDVAATLRRIAANDPSSVISAEALEALGKQDPSEENIKQLLAASGQQSFKDQIRVAAVKALAKLGDARGVECVKSVAAYGQPYKSRPEAIEALGQLGKDPAVKDDVLKFLIGLTDDPQSRSRRAAIRALGALGDEKAIPSLEQIASSGATPDVRRFARDAIAAIKGKWIEPAGIRDLRERVKKLEDREEGVR